MKSVGGISSLTAATEEMQTKAEASSVLPADLEEGGEYVWIRDLWLSLNARKTKKNKGKIRSPKTHLEGVISKDVWF